MLFIFNGYTKKETKDAARHIRAWAHEKQKLNLTRFTLNWFKYIYIGLPQSESLRNLCLFIELLRKATPTLRSALPALRSALRKTWIKQ